MFLRQKTISFVIREREIGEADKVFSVFSKDFGKIEILAKGIRKIASKLKGEIEIFSISEIEFVQGRFQKRLIGARILERFLNLKKNLIKLSLAYKISEILDSLIKGQERDERIFNLIKATFSKLNSIFFKKEKFLFLYFFWNLISFLGYKPNLSCYFCQAKKGNFYFDFSIGNLVCENCSKNVKIGKEINSNSLKILRLIFEKDFNFLERLKLKKEILDPLFSISQEYFSFLSEK